MKTTKIIIYIVLIIHILFSIRVMIADPTLTTFVEILGQRETWAFQITSDLLFGFVLFAVLVYTLENSLKKAVMWFVLANVLGNPAFAIYLLLNLDRLRSGKTLPSSN
ncbi:MAG: hypothetical protein DRR06_09275 [Gammaproteobacteria bacterium]|nr:MAG: hypothetical protein DRR06_09275 [Gammaproteobacteria bacterium]RLA50518.1 MAG: hypothetical protein DRR42_12910 [Gammaproteobacteria bacterium]